jgi:hypothetical protein
LIAEIGDFARFGHPRELASWLGITPSEYSSGDQQHRGHITKAGNRHARRLLIEAAWHYRHAPRRPASGPQPDERAWQAQVRLHHRYRHLTDHGKRSTVVNVAIARELVGFLWAAMTNQPLTTRNQQPTELAGNRWPAAESSRRMGPSYEAGRRPQLKGSDGSVRAWGEPGGPRNRFTPAHPGRCRCRRPGLKPPPVYLASDVAPPSFTHQA